MLYGTRLPHTARIFASLCISIPCLCINTCWSSELPVTDLEDKTAFLVIDDDSLARLGPMPIDRVNYAQAISNARKAGAKAVVMKYFLDTEKSSDPLVQAAMLELPVLLQAGFDKNGKLESFQALEKFTRNASDLRDISHPYRTRALELPNPTLLGAGNALGFVEARLSKQHNKIESFAVLPNGKILPSLQLLLAETAIGTQAKVHGHVLSLGKTHFILDEEGRITCPYMRSPTPLAIPILQLLDDQLPVGSLSGKVVVLAYMRRDTPKIRVSPSLEIPIHEYFYRQALCLIHPN